MAERDLAERGEGVLHAMVCTLYRTRLG